MAEIELRLDEMKLRDLRRAVQNLLKAAEPTAAELQRAVAQSAAEIAAQLRAKAPASDIRQDVFSTVRPRPTAPHIVAHLAGVRLRGRSRPYAKNYREWRARFAYTRLRWRGRRGQKRAIGAGIVQTGQLVGMSLAKMFEYGTAKLRKRPFYWSAVRGGEKRALQMIGRWVTEVLLSRRVMHG